MASKIFECAHCGRRNFKTKRGLTQHQNTNHECKNKMMETLTGKIAKNSNQAAAVCLPANASNFSQINNISKPVELFNVNASRVFNNPTSPTLNKTHAKRQRIVDSNVENATTTQEKASESPSHNKNSHSALEFTEQFDTYSNSSEQSEEPVTLDTSMQKSFNAHACMRLNSSLDLTNSQVTCIRLLLHLRASKASLNAYESLMEWHLEESGKMQPGQTLN